MTNFQEVESLNEFLIEPLKKIAEVRETEKFTVRLTLKSIAEHVIPELKSRCGDAGLTVFMGRKPKKSDYETFDSLRLYKWMLHEVPQLGTSSIANYSKLICYAVASPSFTINTDVGINKNLEALRNHWKERSSPAPDVEVAAAAAAAVRDATNADVGDGGGGCGGDDGEGNVELEMVRKRRQVLAGFQRLAQDVVEELGEDLDADDVVGRLADAMAADKVIRTLNLRQKRRRDDGQHRRSSWVSVEVSTEEDQVDGDGRDGDGTGDRDDDDGYDGEEEEEEDEEAGELEEEFWNERPHHVLGVDVSATREEIIKAYRKKSMEFHPDIIGDQGTDLMQRLNNARDTLMAKFT